jgi:ABC-2 type transport system permease protein
MKKALLIARWEFRSAVMRRAYLFAVLALPLLFGGIGATTALTNRSAQRSSAGTPIAIVDRAGFVDLAFASEQAARRGADATAQLQGVGPAPALSLVAYADVDAAIADVAANKLSAAYVIEPDYLATGHITTYSRDAGMFGQPVANLRVAQVGDAIRASLLKNRLSAGDLSRAYAPAVGLKRLAVDSSGRVTESSAGFNLGRFISSFGIFMLFTMAIFFSAGFLQQATIEDRQNRVFEILLSSATADQLLMGKIIGLGGAGLLQVAIYVVLLLVPGATLFALIDVPFARLGLSLVYFVLGYLLFASCMAATGMLGRTPQESAQMSAFWTMAAIAPMFFLASIMTAPNGWLSRGLSFFPLSSPVTMLLRLTSAEVPPLDIVVSIAIGIVSVYFALRATARIFRAATLMYGKRPNLPELLRWLRAA